MDTPENNQVPEEKPAIESVTFSVKDQHHAETVFRVKRETKFRKVFEVYCNTHGKNLKAVRFLFDGVKILPDDTPDKHQMEDDDIIDVFEEQIGGGTVNADDDIVKHLKHLTIDENEHDQLKMVNDDIVDAFID